MIRASQIPDEVVEAAHDADAACDGKDWMRVAIAGALNAWPGANQYLGAVVLPLPQEARDE